MKKFLLLSIFFLAFNLSAQNTIVQGAWWLSKEEISLGLPNTTYYLSWIEGETTINNNTYAILKRTANNNIVADSYYTETDNKVYRYSTQIDEDQLIYDFNLGQGNFFTVIGVQDFPSNNFEIVTENTIELRDESLAKQLIFKYLDLNLTGNPPYCSMVERLGTISGLFGEYGAQCVNTTDANIHTLIAYGIGDEILYSLPEYDEIETQQELFDNITIDTKTIKNSNISFYPNPTIDYLLIENDLPNTQYHIIDINGKTILTTKETTINLSNLANGIYYLVASNNKHVTTKKLVKM